jgi:hypothetical protein
MRQVSQPKPTPIVMLLADQPMNPWWFLNLMWFNFCFNYNSNMSFWACSQSLNSCIAKNYMYHNGHQQLRGFVFPPLSGILQQYLSVEWPPGQERMDLHIWSLLHADSTGANIPQLPTLVFLWSCYDFLHCLVHDYCCTRPWPGR